MARKIKKREIVILKGPMGAFTQFNEPTENHHAFVCLRGNGMENDLSDDGWIIGYALLDKSREQQTICRDEIVWEKTAEWQKKNGAIAKPRPYRKKSASLSDMLTIKPEGAQPCPKAKSR